MKRLNVSRAIGAGLLTVSLAFLTAPVPATAQGNLDNGSNMTARENRNDRDMDWGWLGLLGLAGLAGLRRRHESHEPLPQRSTAH